jgi:UDP-GlcNAc3NAcA epimerase
MKILTIVGARPQFIKAAAVSHTFKKFQEIEEIILHTGQHFDKGMSEVFFEELGIPEPKYNLNLGGLSHGAMTGQMLEAIERICINERPDTVLVYGDTNSTLAGALAAKKLHIKVAHVEAGLRSYNMRMPEEINRILTDRISDYLFCPTEDAILNLFNEGLSNFDVLIENTGDVMYDAISIFSKASRKPQISLNNDFALCTLHRAENTDSPEKLRSIFAALCEISLSYQLVIPIHPRTKKVIRNLDIRLTDNITLIEPVSYFEMIYLLKEAKIVLTDSGGLQKEAFFMKKPCVTLRDETEWRELVDSEFNVLVGSNSQKIVSGFQSQLSKNHNFDQCSEFYGKGNAAELIAKSLLK